MMIFKLQIAKIAFQKSPRVVKSNLGLNDGFRGLKAIFPEKLKNSAEFMQGQKNSVEFFSSISVPTWLLTTLTFFAL